MNNQRRFLRTSIVLTLFGIMNLVAMITNPATANIRAVDMVRLIGTGMCFGAAIVAIAWYYRGSK